MTQVTITPPVPDPTGTQVAPAPGSGTETRPDWLDSKYKTVEEQAKAYPELVKKLGEKAEATTKSAPTADEAIEAVKKSGLDMAALSQEFSENNGQLTAKTLQALEKQGITSETVNQYIGGLKAQATQMRAEFAQVAGSEEALKGVYEWAAANVDPDVIAAYNDAVISGNIGVAKLALQSLVQQHAAAVGSDPMLIGGDAGANSGAVEPFANSAQVTAAMSDPRYQTDEAYRQSVYRRMGPSNVFQASR
jgi:hypothetical protein